MDADMVDLMIQIDAAKPTLRIQKQKLRIPKMISQIKRQRSSRPKKDLQDAEADRDRQYEDMKKTYPVHI